MKAIIFTACIYDYLLLHAEKAKVADPMMLRAISAAERKNGPIDADKIADCLRCTTDGGSYAPRCTIEWHA